MLTILKETATLLGCIVAGLAIDLLVLALLTDLSMLTSGVVALLGLLLVAATPPTVVVLAARRLRSDSSDTAHATREEGSILP